MVVATKPKVMRCKCQDCRRHPEVSCWVVKAGGIYVAGYNTWARAMLRATKGY